MNTSKIKSLLPLIVFVCGLSVLSKPAYYYMKGVCAQLMLEKAWNLTKRTGHSSKAWGWADTLPVAKLSISSIELNQIVLEGEINEALAFGPAIIESSLESKNKIIAGHRDSFFKKLKYISKNDQIILEHAEGESVYAVENIIIVSPFESKYITNNNRNSLILITCFPFNFIGDAPKRFIVECSLIGN